MKRITVFLLLLAASTHADVVTLSSTGGVVSFTNAQANAAWTPTAVVVAHDAPVSATVTVTRHGNGQAVTLASASLDATRYAVWAPEAAFIFPQGSSLVVSSSVENFTVQLHRKAAP